MDAIVDGYNQLRRIEQGRFVVRNMDEIHLVPAQRERNRNMIPPASLFFRLVKLGEVSGQRPQFVKIAVRTDQQILISTVNGRQIPDKIPDVRTYTKLVDFPDVDCDAHGIDDNFSIIAVC